MGDVLELFEYPDYRGELDAEWLPLPDLVRVMLGPAGWRLSLTGPHDPGDVLTFKRHLAVAVRCALGFQHALTEWDLVSALPGLFAHVFPLVSSYRLPGQAGELLPMEDREIQQRLAAEEDRLGRQVTHPDLADLAWNPVLGATPAEFLQWWFRCGAGFPLGFPDDLLPPIPDGMVVKEPEPSVQVDTLTERDLLPCQQAQAEVARLVPVLRRKGDTQPELARRIMAVVGGEYELDTVVKWIRSASKQLGIVWKRGSPGGRRK